jgi:hypothetical protein
MAIRLGERAQTGSESVQSMCVCLLDFFVHILIVNLMHVQLFQSRYRVSTAKKVVLHVGVLLRMVICLEMCDENVYVYTRIKIKLFSDVMQQNSS